MHHSTEDGQHGVGFRWSDLDRFDGLWDHLVATASANAPHSMDAGGFNLPMPDFSSSQLDDIVLGGQSLDNGQTTLPLPVSGSMFDGGKSQLTRTGNASPKNLNDYHNDESDWNATSSESSSCNNKCNLLLQPP